MTQDEILDMKVHIAHLVETQMEKYIGMPVSEVMADVIRNHLRDMMENLFRQGHSPVTGLIDWDVVISGPNAQVLMKPKKGLSDEDYRKVISFISNREFR